MIPEDCALVTRAIGDAMLDSELPQFEVLEFTDGGLSIKVSPANFTRWRVALPVDSPRRVLTATMHSLISRGRIEGVPVTLETTAWLSNGESLEGVAS